MSRYFLTALMAIACTGLSVAQTLESRPAQPAASPVAPRALANNEATYLKLRNNSVEGHVPLKGLKEKPKRAMLAYYDDVLGAIENR